MSLQLLLVVVAVVMLLPRLFGWVSFPSFRAFLLLRFFVGLRSFFVDAYSRMSRVVADVGVLVLVPDEGVSVAVAIVDASAGWLMYVCMYVCACAYVGVWV